MAHVREAQHGWACGSAQCMLVSSAAAVFAQMDLYDMIILGFEDMYGELNANVAQAVVDYIETGKKPQPVLLQSQLVCRSSVKIMIP